MVGYGVQDTLVSCELLREYLSNPDVMVFYVNTYNYQINSVAHTERGIETLRSFRLQGTVTSVFYST